MPGQPTDLPVLIAGGGIGGLSAAIALARAGFTVEVLEQAEAFSEAGAGIQLGPNAMRILGEWGVRPGLRPQAVMPDSIRLFDGLNGDCLNEVPLGRQATERYGAPYCVLHRADLQQGLLAAARSYADISITNAFYVADISIESGTVRVSSSDGNARTGSVLIGADGIWSQVRKIVCADQPEFTGKTAWRTIVPAARVPTPFAGNFTGLWMAPQAHLVHYPVHEGNSVNVVAVTDDSFAGRGWGVPGDAESLLAHYKHWNQRPRGFLESLEGWHKWALFAMPPLKRWWRGPVALLGDAAHPPVPFLAQGGAMAIEGAAVLAMQLRMADGDLRGAFEQYQALRHPRVERVYKASGRMGRIYHLKGLPRLARNMAVRRRTGESLLSAYDWLYGFALSDKPGEAATGDTV